MRRSGQTKATSEHFASANHSHPRSRRRGSRAPTPSSLARIEDARGECFARKRLAHAMPAEDRRQEADAVAAEVVQQPRVPGMATDDADPAVVVAHQAV